MDEKITLLEPQKLAFSTDITHCHPYLRDRWPDLLYRFNKFTGNDLVITCSWRSVAQQAYLYEQGRTRPGPKVTQLDGVNHKSNHNVYPARAIDVAIDNNVDQMKHAVTWDEMFYFPLARLCRELGLVSGGSWENFKDWPHVEVPKEIP
jgi:peptidoglycan L-alanyl-D-glutamate endopeptidase CwlK